MRTTSKPPNSVSDKKNESSDYLTVDTYVTRIFYVVFFLSQTVLFIDVNTGKRHSFWGLKRRFFALYRTKC